MSDTRDASTDQVEPQANDQPAAWLLVIADMQERHNHGVAKYGVPLQPHNGRDPLLDLYQELLDAAVYVKTRMLEEKATDLESLKFLLDELMTTAATPTTPENVRVVCGRRDALAREIVKWGARAMSKPEVTPQRLERATEKPEAEPAKKYPMRKGDGHQCITMGGKTCINCGEARTA